MRILFIGDVVGSQGVEYIKEKLFGIRKNYKIDMCIANGENSSYGNGISKKSGQGLYDGGVDAITLGNHGFARVKELDEIFDGRLSVVRPANLSKCLPGKGHIIIQTEYAPVAIINLLGRMFMNPANCPFEAVDRELELIGDKAAIKLVDFHAEATSEKLIMLNYLDGRVTGLVGTHTHVQTADERVTKNGTAYITDLGMTGPLDSILGVDKEAATTRMVTQFPVRFEVAEGQCIMSGVIIEVNDNDGKAISVERVNIVQ